MRTFIALELPDAFIDEAAGVARSLSESLGGRFVKRASTISRWPSSGS